MHDTKEQLQAKYDGLMQELHSAWNDWDALIDRGDRGENVLESDRTQCATDGGCAESPHVPRNLLRDMDEVLES